MTITRASKPGSPRAAWLLIMLLPLLALAARLLPGLRTFDDAYITFRYARNIVTGLGFVYNPGEHVLGTTTPLYTLLMAGLGLAGGSTQFPPLAMVINALCDAVNTLLLIRIVRHLTRHWAPAVVIGALWVLAPQSVNAAIGGMETSLYVMLMLGAWWVWLTASPAAPRRSLLSAALTGLATLTRPDALIWAGPLGLAMIAQRWMDTSPAHIDSGRKNNPIDLLRRLPWAEAGIFAAIVAPWVIYSTLYFGSPLPHSIAAKMGSTSHQDYSAFLIMAGTFSIPFYEFFVFGLNATVLGIFIYPSLALLGTIAAIRASWRSAPMVVFFWLYLGAFAVTNFTVFQWYYVPALAVYLPCIVGGAWVLCRRLGGDRRPQAAMAILGLVWVFFSLNAWTLHPGYAQDRPMPRIVWNRLVLIYGDIARGLASSADPDATLAATDIGALGWESGLRILDTVGLISPEADRYYPIPGPVPPGEEGYAIPPNLILDRKPDYIVIMERYGSSRLLNDPRFIQAYTRVDRRQVDAEWGYMLVYRRTKP